MNTLKAREGSCAGTVLALASTLTFAFAFASNPIIIFFTTGETVTHAVTVFDPLEVFAAGGALEGDGQLGKLYMASCKRLC